ncbi:MAG: ATP-binding cassette domain-containing protein [Myxococcota bacterium]
MLAGQLVAPVVRLAGQWRQLQLAWVGVLRLGDVLDARDEAMEDRSSVLVLPPVRGHIAFRDVSFAYHPDDPPVLSQIDLEIAPGEIVGIVGRSGCGKSTLVRLLLRLHDPQRGEILVDGHALRDVTLVSLRLQVGIVTQDTSLLSGTVYDNIAAGRDVSEHDVVRAAEVAGADAFVRRLPYGYNTRVGERGLPLSGGQRQRLVLARALVGDPRILIFDEATAALDPLSEQEIHEALQRVVRGRTTLIVSHRIKTLEHVDPIVVLDRGRIVEEGTPAALLAQGGAYHRLATAAPGWAEDGA